MAIDLGTAYISVVPTTKDLDKNIRTALDSSVKHADRAGNDMGLRLAANLTSHVGKAGDKSGEVFSRGFGARVQSAGRSVLQGLANVMIGGAQGIGGELGGGISAGMTGAINKGATEAIDALGAVGTRGGALMSSRLQTAGMLAAGGIALVGTAAIAATNELYKIGAAWDDVSDGITSRTGLIGSELSKVTDSVKNVAIQTAAAPGDIAKVASQLVQTLKLSGADLEVLTKQISDYNEMNADAPINVREFAKAMKQFGVTSAKDLSDTLNRLNNIAQNTGIPLNDLISSLRTAAPVAREFKMPLAEVTQLLATFEDAGLNAESAATLLKLALGNLAAKDPNADPVTALQNVVTKIQELSNSGRDLEAIDLAKSTFGRSWDQILPLIKENRLEVDNLNTSTAALGPTIEQQRKATEDFTEEWRKFKNFLEIELLPGATAVFGGINDILSGLTTNIRSYIDLLRGGDGKVTTSGFGSNVTGSAMIPGGGGPNASRERRGLPATTDSGGLFGGGGLTAGSGGIPAGVGGGGRGWMNSGATSAYLDWQTIQSIASSNGLSLSSGYRPGDSGFHGQGQARDFAGTQQAMLAFANDMADKYGPQLKELIFDHPAFTRNVKNGQFVGKFGSFYTESQAGPHWHHVHLAFASGGRVSGPGTSTSDSIPALLSNGEHVLTAKDVNAMGGQGAVYNFRNALHRAGGGPILMDIIPQANVEPDGKTRGDGGKGDWRQRIDDPNTRPRDPRSGDQGIGLIPGDSFRITGPDTDQGWFFPWWWRFWGDNQLDGLTPSGKIRQNLKMWGNLWFAQGGAVDEELLKQHQGTGALPGPEVHKGSGALPGPAQLDTPLDTSNRTGGFVPVAAGNTGVAGTSFVSGLLNLGNEAVSGAIDAGAQLAQMAASAAIAGGTMGAGAAASPAAGPAASAGIQIAANIAKRASAFGFQLAGIGADSLIAQLFPFGAPRWLGYDYTALTPQMTMGDFGVTTGEKAANQAQGQAVAPGQDAGGPVQPSTMPGAAQSITPHMGSQALPGPAPMSIAPPNPNDDLLSRIMGYDQGGMLPPGGLGINMTNRPEPVLTPQQWDSINRVGAAEGRGPLVKIDTIYGMSPEDVASQIESKQKLAMMRYAGRP